MFGANAHLYDAIYANKDYAAEAKIVRQTLQANGVGPGARVLEAACGTGRYLEHLQEIYTVSGFDRSQPLLDIARTRLPAVPLWAADMREVTVENPVDAVICLFSSIGYLNAEGLRAALARFAAAVRHGGVVLVEPWQTPARGLAIMRTHDGPALKAARSAVVQVFGAKTRLDFYWTVAYPHRGVETFVERHELYAFESEMLQESFQDAGLQPTFAEGGLTGRGMWIGQKTAASG